VVDDNTMNLMVFKSLLKQTQLKIDMAESGNEAVSLVCDKKYDMIFLDHMMPEKDGIETLHEIRALEGHPNQETPAVCLTANAISGAREKYISVGFDDYLTKPVDAEKLEKILIEYLPKDKVTLTELNAADANGKQEDNGEETQIPEILEPLKTADWIDLETGLMNSGGLDSYMPLLKIFYFTLDEKADEIQRFYEQEDWKNYTIKVHALKSSARIIGASGFGEKAQLLENAGKEGDEKYILTEHEGFLSEYRSFKGALAPIFEEKQEDKPEADPELMADVYEELKAAADDMDCDRIFDAFAEMEQYSIPESHREKWKMIRDAAERYDYEAVVEVLK